MAESMRTATFKKQERLKSRKTIEALFKQGHSFAVYPLRLVWLRTGLPPGKAPVQFAVSVPKKNFKSAVARNHIRRKIKEAWRQNKYWLYERLQAENRQFAFMVIFVAREDLPLTQIVQAMRTLNRRFLKMKEQEDAANPLAKDGTLS